MAEERSNKLKILYLMKILMEKTDATHSITMEEIISSLKAYDIEAERKGLYRDIESLKTFGMDIQVKKEKRNCYYWIANRQFELAELKLLVDSVQAAKFITKDRSNQLIRKLEGLASKYEAQKLQRQVYTAERIKTDNDMVINNVDAIHQAIAANRKIRFQYFNWNVKKECELRKNGEFYHISPWALSWDDENYYMVGYDSEAERIKHYRVDKMLNIALTEDLREGSKNFERFDMGAYAKRLFGMFDGDEEIVQIDCENYLAGVFVDRFGKNVMMRKLTKDTFRVNVKVCVSNQFLSWVFALGDGAKIVGPKRVTDKVNQLIDRLATQYRSE